MNRNLAIVLSIFAIGYFGFLMIVSTNVFAEVPLNYEYIFEETLVISDKMEVSLNYEYIFEETLGISDKIEVSLNG